MLEQWHRYFSYTVTVPNFKEMITVKSQVSTKKKNMQIISKV